MSSVLPSHTTKTTAKSNDEEEEELLADKQFRRKSMTLDAPVVDVVPVTMMRAGQGRTTVELKETVNL